MEEEGSTQQKTQETMADGKTTSWADLTEEAAKKTKKYTAPTAMKSYASQAQEFFTADVAYRGIRFNTPKTTPATSIIKLLLQALKDDHSVQHLQQMPSGPDLQHWNAILSKQKYVDDLLTLQLPPLPDTEYVIKIVPVRKRPLTITIPFAAPNISNEDIAHELAYEGHVISHRTLTYEEFPWISTGKRIFMFLPEDPTNVSPFLIVRGQKLLLSFRGRKLICMNCNSREHRSAECPRKGEHLCFQCASPDHSFRECPKRYDFDSTKGTKEEEEETREQPESAKPTLSASSSDSESQSEAENLSGAEADDEDGEPPANPTTNQKDSKAQPETAKSPKWPTCLEDLCEADEPMEVLESLKRRRDNSLTPPKATARKKKENGNDSF